jgi:DtxR family Mn-dependent transcriptional regulator
MAHYLGELYRLGGHREYVSPSALAAELDVSPPAVARMGGRLSERGLVDRKRYRGVRLTSRGEREALREIRYHRMAEAFLVNVLKYGWHEAHDMADALAEIANEGLISRMEQAAGHPTRCPHGEPIPSADGTMVELHDLPLTDLAVGAFGVISRVRIRESQRLEYLAREGLFPRTRFRVEGRGPFGGPVRVRLDRGEVVLGAEIAGQIYIDPD